MYKLIMLPNPILVSDEEKQIFDRVWNSDVEKILRVSEVFMPHGNKIIAGIEGLPKLDLSAIEEEIGWVDVEKLAKEFIKDEWTTSDEPVKFGIEVGYEAGFKAAQSLNEKKFSGDDVKKAILMTWDNSVDTKNMYDVIESLSEPKTYNVEVKVEEYDHKEEWSEIGGAFETFKTKIKVTKILS